MNNKQKETHEEREIVLLMKKIKDLQMEIKLIKQQDQEEVKDNNLLMHDPTDNQEQFKKLFNEQKKKVEEQERQNFCLKQEQIAIVSVFRDTKQQYDEFLKEYEEKKRQLKLGVDDLQELLNEEEQRTFISKQKLNEKKDEIDSLNKSKQMASYRKQLREKRLNDEYVFHELEILALNRQLDNIQKQYVTVFQQKDEKKAELESDEKYKENKAILDDEIKQFNENELEICEEVQKCAELECCNILHEQQIMAEKKEKKQLYDQIQNLKESLDEQIKITHLKMDRFRPKKEQFKLKKANKDLSVVKQKMLDAKHTLDEIDQDHDEQEDIYIHLEDQMQKLDVDNQTFLQKHSEIQIGHDSALDQREDHETQYQKYQKLLKQTFDQKIQYDILKLEKELETIELKNYLDYDKTHNDLFSEIKRVKIKMEQFKDIQRQFIQENETIQEFQKIFKIIEQDIKNG